MHELKVDVRLTVRNAARKNPQSASVTAPVRLAH
jgi:hypothetical protein